MFKFFMTTLISSFSLSEIRTETTADMAAFFALALYFFLAVSILKLHWHCFDLLVGKAKLLQHTQGEFDHDRKWKLRSKSQAILPISTYIGDLISKLEVISCAFSTIEIISAVFFAEIIS